jgi:hypothetical protein
MSDDTTTPTLKRSSTPVETPPDAKRAKAVSFEDTSVKGATSSVLPEHEQLLASLVQVLQTGHVNVAAVIAVFSDLEALPLDATATGPAATEHLFLVERLRVASEAAHAKATAAAACPQESVPVVLSEDEHKSENVVECVA